MVVLDILSTVPVEMEFVQSMIRAVVISGTVIECDLGRRRRDRLFSVPVLVVVPSCFKDFNVTREGIDIVASHDPTGGKDSVNSTRASDLLRTCQILTLALRRQRRTQE